MKTAPIRVVHIFDKDNPYGGCTVAYSPEVFDSAGYPKGRFAKVAVAWCNQKDRYSRPLGESLAIEKLLNNQCVVLPIYQDGHPVRQIKYMFENMVERQQYDAEWAKINW